MTLTRENIKDIYSLSPMQEGMFFHALYDKSSPAYLEQTLFRYHNPLNIQLVEKSLNELLKRHDVLRTVFTQKIENKILQVVLKERTIDFLYEDISKNKDKEDYIRHYREKDRKRMFDLTRDVLMRVAVFRLEPSMYQFIWTFHHIVMDGWCTGILISEFIEIYYSYIEGREYRLSPAGQYGEYIHWLGNRDNAGSIIYWQTYLSGYEEAVSIPGKTAYPGESKSSEYRVEEVSLAFSAKETGALNRLAGENNVALNTVIHALWGILLGKYNNREDVVFGAVVSGRSPEVEGIETMVGLFINTVPVRAGYSRGMSFNELLQALRRRYLESETHHYCSLAEIQAASLLKQDLFDHILIFENYPTTERIHELVNKNNPDNTVQTWKLSMSNIEMHEQTNYDFNVIAIPGKRLTLGFQFNPDIYNREQVEDVSGRFKGLVDQVLKKNVIKIEELEIISEKERTRILLEFNDTEAGYPEEKRIEELFIEQAARTPDNVAVVGAGTGIGPISITYNELNKKSGQLATVLREKGAAPDTIVGIMVERSLEMIIGILGILRAGGAYLPIDPDYPQERIDYMLADSNAAVVLNFEHLNFEFVSNFEFRASNLSSSELAYIIYTSGTTGKPKGVMIEHRSVVNMLTCRKSAYGMTSEDVSLQLFSYSFDGFVASFFTPVISGAKVILLSKDGLSDMEKVCDAIVKNRVTHFISVPLLYGEIIENIAAEDTANLKTVTLAGDKVPHRVVDVTGNKNEHIEIANEYGITEVSVMSTIYRHQEKHDRIKIGKPVWNTFVYILNKEDRIQPIGILGELYIGGAGLARGYLNNPELTTERFINYKQITNPKLRHTNIYKTGDLARWLLDGNIEFLGRIDNQVKIRGFRIETGEIESRLLKHNEIKEAVVVARGDKGEGREYLCGYIVSVSDRELPTSRLREYLSGSLPGYMIPSYFVQLERLPLTPNGKVNRKALPEPELALGENYAAPGNAVERKLTAIWSEVLSIEKEVIGIDANFFQLGGHSLKAITLSFRIYREFNIKIELPHLFKRGTIRQLAEYIRDVEKDTLPAAEPVEKKEYYVMSSAQKRLFFLQQMDPEGIGYNMFQVLPLEIEIDGEKLENIFKRLIKKHESLRTSFKMIDEEPVQIIHDEVEFKIDYYSSLEVAVRPFDLSQAPLLRVGLVKKGETEQFLLLDMHHIISDGTSQNILAAEFTALYSGGGLSPLKLQYKDYAQGQNPRMQQKWLKLQESYWLRLFSPPDELPVLDLPTDYPRPRVRSFEGRRVSFILDEKETRKLKALGTANNATLYMCFLSVFGILLSKLCGQEDIIIGTPVTTREHADLEHIVGMFVNTLAVRSWPSGEKTFTGYLREVKEQVLKAFENRDYPFEALVDKIWGTRDTGRNPVFDVMFGLNNSKDQYLEESPYENSISKFDLGLEVFAGLNVRWTLEYCTRLFKEETIERYAAYFKKIISGVILEPAKRISHMEIISEEEKREILTGFNDASGEYPGGMTIHALFETQVEKVPGAAAAGYTGPEGCVVFVTYGELNNRARQAARVLKEKGVVPGSIVALKVERSIEMIIGLLGILKAGCAYLPIDPGYPAERIDFMLRDSNAAMVLNFEHLNFEFVSNFEFRAPDLSSPELAYIIYTSGSTGKPKGVMIEHRNVVNRVRKPNYIDFSEGDRLLLTGALVFDITTFEIWGSLLNGLTLYLADEDTILDGDKLGETVARNNISIMHLVPQLFNQLFLFHPGIFAGLEYFLVGGDLVRAGDIDELRTRYQGLKILHMYGPTENTTFSTFFPVERTYETALPIGKPVSHASVYIVNRWNELQPVGVTGELVVGGDGVSRGYLNNPELTAERFIHHSAILYKTGDLARWQPDGNIEFLGRIDHQVKIRGFRIETGEIEKVLCGHNEIEECVVLSREISGDTQLIAYYKKRNMIKLWPSLAEYFLYDDLIYHSMVNDEARNEKYRRAIARVVKDKVVLEIGPGSEAILSRLCIEAGARKVYAVEILEEAYRKARERVKALGWEDRIHLIHGDITEVTLPEKVDCCVSEIVGSIGGSEGAAKLVNSARNLLNDPRCMIPVKSQTNIAAVTLPEDEFEYGFDEIGAHYVEKIFHRVEHPFDLRLCLLSLPREKTISTSDIFETLDFTKENPLENEHDIYLEITKNSILNGFIVWLVLFCDEEEIIDTLERKYIWLPVYFPVFARGEAVHQGDYIKAKVKRKLSANKLNPDYILEGTLYKKQENRFIDIFYDSPHFPTTFKGNEFYKKVFSKDELKISGDITVNDLREFLAGRVPDYMIPSYFVELEKIPLTSNGKIHRKALPLPEVEKGMDYMAAGDETEEKLVEIWSEVLGIEKEIISINSDFFKLGGHSLKATILLAKIHKVFDVKIPLTVIFKAPEIRATAAWIKGAKKDAYSPLKAVEKREYYALSPAQKRLFILQQMELTGTAYNMPSVIPLPGELDFERLEDTFKKLIQRHESLRTRFLSVDDAPVQGICDEVEFEIADYRAGSHAGIAEDIVSPFDLSQAPLLRVGLIETGEGKPLLFIDMHHIITDGTSMDILAREFAGLYAGEALPPPAFCYKDYSQWQNSSRYRDMIKQQETYWTRLFSDDIPVLQLPTDFPRPFIRTFEGTSVNFTLNANETEALKNAAKGTGTTLYMIILAAVNMLLSKLSGQEDIVIGTPVEGRRRDDLRRIIGMFVNTLAVRNYPSGEKTVKAFLKEVKEQTLSAFENQDYPFEELVDKVSTGRDTGRSPLFDVLFNFLNRGEYESKRDIIGDINPTSKFDMSLTAVDLGEKVAFNIEYCTALFHTHTIERFFCYFQHLISAISTGLEETVGHISIIDEAEKQRVLYEFNDTGAGYPRDKTIHRLFDEQVERSPDHIAVIGGRELHKKGNISLTYKELNEKSVQSAALLKEKGVLGDDIIGLMVERSIEVVIGIFAILKAGAAYLPIDPDYPKERINYMLADSGANILLSDQAGVIDVHVGNRLACSAHHLPPGPVTGPAYVIYTSGTTGKPKGVMVEQGNVVTLMTNARRFIDYNKDDVWSLFHSYCFDFSVWEMYGALLFGGRLVIISKMAARDTEGFLQVLKEEKVTVLNQTPRAFYNLAETVLKESSPGLHVRCVIFGGEALNPSKLKEWYRRFPGIRLINMFGITETTVHVTFKELEKADVESSGSIIGKPLPGWQTYILDKNGCPVPVKVCGELYVGGSGVARGYLNRPELTAERFCPPCKNVFFHHSGRVYKTGDLARWLPDGNLEYLGRIDHQVKIRGFRIELGEIETRLLRHKDINAAVVEARENGGGDKYLCAYFVPAGSLNTGELREYLSQQLPEYMIPAYFVPLEEIPVTSSGKTDKKALPEPVPGSGIDAAYVPPTNETEKKLVEIWRHVLGAAKDKIGIDNNFFALGGHSLNATIMIAKIHKAFHVKIPLAAVFKMPYIKELAQYVKNSLAQDRYRSLQPGEEKEYYPLSSAQERLYVLQQMEPTAVGYNILQVVSLEGKPDRERLDKVAGELIQRHDSLRTSMVLIEGKPVQRIYDNVVFEIEYEDSQVIIKDFMRPFDLSKAPLLRMEVVNTGKENYLLLTDMHHIITDGTSMDLLVHDFIAGYNGKGFAPLKLRYRDYAEWQTGDKTRERLTGQEDYWLGVFPGEVPVLNLPTDFTRPSMQRFEGARQEFRLGPTETNALKTLALEETATLFMVLLAVFNIFLSKLCGQGDIVVGTPVEGRRNDDLRRIIGMFVNTLALRNYPAEDKTPGSFLRELKERTLSAFENQEYPFEDLVGNVSVERDVSRNPIFDVMMVLIQQNTYPPEGEPGELKLKPNDFEPTTAKVDLKLQAVDEGDKLLLGFVYSIHLFKPGTVERFARYFKNVVKCFTGNPMIPLSEIEIITEEEKKRILYDFNDTDEKYPEDKTLHELFEDRQKITPDRAAVVDENRTVTYRTLHETADRLAWKLRKKGVTGDTVVGVMIKRSLEMMVGIMGILKAGGAYLPVSPDYPRERIDYMLSDSGAKILLGEESGIIDVDVGNRLACSDDLDCQLSTSSLKAHLHHSVRLAYVIYTSGSTGKPKGVMMEHRSIVNLLNWMQRHYPLDGQDVLLQKAPYTFDVSVWEIFRWALAGAKLCLLTHGGEKDPQMIVRAIERNHVTIVHFVPSMLKVFLEYIKESVDIKKLASLKRVLTGGEALTLSQIKAFHEIFYLSNLTRLANLYGPTEAAVDVSYYDCPVTESRESIPIGKPIDNIRLYVMDSGLHLQPIGVAGELYIAGAGLARGYLNKPELTAEKFIHHFDLLYKTGDLARWLPDGNIQFSGRIDQQVKIRGFRIEPGEIESLLIQHEEIKEAVVATLERNPGDRYLCAYIVSGKEIEPATVKSYLSARLPAFMIPSYVIRVEEIPLTSNGKCDWKSLPVPVMEDIPRGEYTAPSGEIEKNIVKLWQEVLGMEKIGIHDNFFSIGGDSIKAIQLAARMNKAGYGTEVRHIFDNPSISGIMPLIKPVDPGTRQSIITGIVPLTPIQEAFFQYRKIDPHHYNHAVMFYRKEGFDEEALKAVFTTIQEHHDALRMSFSREKGKIIQRNHGLDYPFSFSIFDFRDRENGGQLLETKAGEIQASIDLATGPLMKVVLFKLDDGHRLLIVIHHLVIDGISWRILLEDMAHLYGRYKKGEPLALPFKTGSFKQWSEKLSTYADSRLFLKEKTYWTRLEQEAALIPPIEKDFEEEKNLVKDRSRLAFRLNREETGCLLTKVNRAFGTEINDILLTALALSTRKMYGLDRLLITLEGHGRERIPGNVDVGRTVGWFTSKYPVILDISYENDMARQLKEVKESLRKVPNKGIGWGILKYLTSGTHKTGVEFRSNSRVIFNYLGQFDPVGVREQESFEFAGESYGNLISPESEREYELEISGVIMDKQLNMSIDYNPGQFKTATIETLLDYYKKELQALISFCVNKKESERTPADLTYKELSIDEFEGLCRRYPVEDIYPLTPMQEGMLFNALYDDSSAVNFIQLSYRLNGEMDIAVVKKCMKELVKRCEVLRTVFIHEGLNRPLQVVLKAKEMGFYYKDLRKLDSREDKETFISQFKERERDKTFDLGKDIISTLTVMRIEDEEYEFTWSHHHILMDGWSTVILIAEFFELYTSCVRNRECRLPAVKPYRQYIRWLESRDKEQSEIYWTNYLKGYRERPYFLEMKRDQGNRKVYKREELQFTLEEEKTAALKEIAARNNVTVNTFMQAAWGILIGKYTQRQDVVFLQVVSGRPAEIQGIETMVGLFINSIPVRIRFDEDTTFDELLRNVQADGIASEPHHDYPLADIQALTSLEKRTSDHIMVFENYPAAEQLDGVMTQDTTGTNQIKLTNIEEIGQTVFDFNLKILPGNQIAMKFEYNAHRYEREVVKRAADHFCRILEQVTTDAEINLRDLTLFSKEKRNKMISHIRESAEFMNKLKGVDFNEIF